MNSDDVKKFYTVIPFIVADGTFEKFQSMFIERINSNGYIGEPSNTYQDGFKELEAETYFISKNDLVNCIKQDKPIDYDMTFYAICCGSHVFFVKEEIKNQYVYDTTDTVKIS